MRFIVTGKTSYIAVNLKSFLEKRGHICKTVSLREGIKDADFSESDAVIHCAGIVHKRGGVSAEEFKRVNVSLTAEAAAAAKRRGVKQFIFLSSMSVYGNDISAISESTPKRPSSLYGESKLSAEKEIFKLADDKFIVAALRPPMVYGKGCPGNYASLRKIALKAPIFPKASNKRSFIYIENLCFFISELAEKKKGGVFLPMDGEYISTEFLAENIAKAHGKKIRLSAAAGTLTHVFKNLGIIKKAFGSLYYDESCADRVNFISVKDAIKKTES